MKQELRSANFQQLPSLPQPSVTLFFFATWKLRTLIRGWHKFLARDENCRQTTPRFTREWQGSVTVRVHFLELILVSQERWGNALPHTKHCFSKILCISWNEYSCDRHIVMLFMFLQVPKHVRSLQPLLKTKTNNGHNGRGNSFTLSSCYFCGK